MRWLTVWIGIVISAVFSWITPWSNIVHGTSPLGGSHFSTASLGLIVILSLLWNGLPGKLSPKVRLRAGEMLYIWIMGTIATTLSYTGFARTFILNISWHPELVRKFLPLGNIFPDSERLAKAVLQGIEGGERAGILSILEMIPWYEWIPILLVWIVFIAFVIAALFGIASVFSHQWIDNEKMALPLLHIPKVFSEESERSSIIKSIGNAFFITGLMIPAFIHTINGLATYFPNIPQIPTLFLAQPYIPQEGILKGFAKLKIYIYPAFVGFAYMAPRQISLSVWFFFLLGFLIPGLLGIFGVAIPNIALGTTFGPGVAKIEETQMIGAYGVCALFILWLARSHIRALIFDRNYLAHGVEYTGLVHPRIGLILFVVGYAGTAGWLVMAGMDIAVVLPFLVICFMLQIVVTKMICQGGLPYFTLPVAPSDGFLAFLPTKILSPASIYIGAVVQKMAFLDVRESIVPTLVHASAIARYVSENRRKILTGVIISIATSLFVSTLAMLVICYKYGALSLADTWAIETVSRVHEKALALIQHPEAPKPWIAGFVIAGALVMVALIIGYHRFVWWPLHPMGYLMTYNTATQLLWFSFFLGWLCNRFVFVYGGLKTYTTVRWFFVGLIVGDVIMAILWIVVGWFAPTAYHVFPT
ncbi:MAG: DUF6785 family protein [Thermodesulforhabdaceae bacterium]